MKETHEGREIADSEGKDKKGLEGTIMIRKECFARSTSGILEAFQVE
jgi:hypothetical protein